MRYTHTHRHTHRHTHTYTHAHTHTHTKDLTGFAPSLLWAYYSRHSTTYALIHRLALTALLSFTHFYTHGTASLTHSLTHTNSLTTPLHTSLSHSTSQYLPSEQGYRKGQHPEKRHVGFAVVSSARCEELCKQGSDDQTFVGLAKTIYIHHKR